MFMKSATGILLVLLFPASLFSQTGADCANVIPLTLDGVCRTYATSSTVDTSKICTNTIYSGASPVTFFSFTTNSTPDKVLLHVTAPTSEPMEILFFSSSSCSPFISSSSMCFDDGEGYWAASHTYTFLPGFTYLLRIKTTTVGDITICANHYTPANDNCSGAFTIGPEPITDNNACHTGGPGVVSANLCAVSLENTAFYTYTVEHEGVTIINLNNISCDNGNNNNSNGFQVGFFSGSCGTLTPISCYTGSGSFITATTDTLPVGTNVYVAIDGTAGTNCSYSINVINGLPLNVAIKNFAGWKKASSNLLTWTSVRESGNDYFEIERSDDGNRFIAIGKVYGQQLSYTERNYQLEDASPPRRCYYRLKQVNKTGNTRYYNTILVVRENQVINELSFQNPTGNNFRLSLDVSAPVTVRLRIIALTGIVIYDQVILCRPGINTFSRNLGFLSSGNYLLEATSGKTRMSRMFIKTNNP
jgi:hypothetical protein